MDRVNRDAVHLVRSVAAEFGDVQTTVSGNLGPRGDGYAPDALLTPDEARRYHRPQIASLADAGADHVTLLTATHVGEAIGVVMAAGDVGVDVVISFTVETDGHLPSGQPLLQAVAEVDDATAGAVLHFGVNCAHPDHVVDALTKGPSSRLGLLRANASRMRHAELDACDTLDDGDVDELAASYSSILDDHPSIRVVGGCCGTDPRHVEAIAAACSASA